MNPKVDFYFSKNKKWQKEIEQLRKIVLDCGLTEELKWGCPCYTSPTVSSPSEPARPPEPERAGADGRAFQQSNIVLIHVFKEYCALLFFKGALLNDAHGMLIRQTENVQAARQIRFTSIQQIVKTVKILTAYIFEAIEVEKAGLKVNLKKPEEFTMAEEFKRQLNKNPVLKSAFKALTPGRQRAYLLHFSQPKQSKTRESRVEKWMQQILDGKGLND
jgi:uncharacterized protein YdeI (YjbR/CyaY-like superfamily)